jgi:hypothetical protein
LVVFRVSLYAWPAWTTILLTTASQIAMIIGISHHTQPPKILMLIIFQLFIHLSLLEVHQTSATLLNDYNKSNAVFYTEGNKYINHKWKCCVMTPNMMKTEKSNY